MERMDYEKFLEYILQIGRKLVESGAEVKRAEDTVRRICAAYHVEGCEAYATTTQLLVTIKDDKGRHITQFARILGTRNDLTTLEEVNQVARQICKEVPPLDELKERVSNLGKIKVPWLKQVCGYVFAGSGFAWFFGGDFRDVIAAMIIAVLIYAMDKWLDLQNYNRLLYTLVSCMICGLASMLLVQIGIGHHADMISIGIIMLFIPGLAVSNAMREMFYGDIMAGIFRLLGALLEALAIAAGYAIAAWIGGLF